MDRRALSPSSVSPSQKSDPEQRNSPLIFELDQRLSQPGKFRRGGSNGKNSSRQFTYEDYKSILRADSGILSKNGMDGGGTIRSTGAPSSFGSEKNSPKSRLMTALPRAQSPLPALEEKISERFYYYIPQKIDQAIESIEIWRLITKKFILTNWIGIGYTWGMLLLSIFSTLEFIYQTYIDPGLDPYSKHSYRHRQSDLYLHMRSFEKVVSIIFAFDWSLSLFLADSKVNYVTSFFSIVDLLTVIPIWITSSVTCPIVDEVQNFRGFILYIICGLSTIRILRALRVHRWIRGIEDQVRRYLFEMIMVIAGILFFNAAVLQYLEAHLQPLQFHTWMYFSWVTVATIGYGDISAQSILGRFFVMGTIAFAIVTIPKMTNELIEKMREQSIYQRIHYNPKKSKSHVLICGDMSSVFLEEFFEELFHEDHSLGDISGIHAVVLQSHPPTYEMMKILEHPTYSIQITYLEGSALSQHDLERAKATSAIAIFILANKLSPQPDEEDAKTILIHSYIKRVLALNPRHTPLVCVQLIRPRNRRHLTNGGVGLAGKGTLLGDAISGTTSVHDNREHVSPFAHDEQLEDIVICVDEVKMGVIAKNVLFPGTATLLMNLITSFSDEDTSDTSSDGGPAIDRLDDDLYGNWMGEYRMGCEWEVYTTVLSDMFVGVKFSVLSETLYLKLDILLFALEVEDLRRPERGNVASKRLLLNPGDFTIPPAEESRVLAFVLAKNNTQGDLSFAAALDEQSNVADRLHLNLLTLRPLNPVLSAFHKLSSEKPLEKAVETDSNAKNSDFKAAKNADRRIGWKLLRSKQAAAVANEAKQVETFRTMEADRRAADENLSKVYFLRSVDDPLPMLDDIIIHSSVAEELPHICNHTIIITKTFRNMYELLLPLRARYCPLKYIVILCPTSLSTSEWRRISRVQGVLILYGTGLEENDLIRAGVLRASNVVILADTTEAHDFRGDVAAVAVTNEALVDSDAIFTYQCVRRLNDRLQVVVEIIRQSNVSYLAESESDLSYQFSPLFAAGILFTAQLLDLIVCQALHNPQIVFLIEKLINSTSTSNSHAKSTANESASSRGVSSALYQIAIPEDLESKTYGSLFKYLVSRHIVPIGLLRGVFPQLQIGPKGNKLPYVFTNPPKDTELFSCDRVFVLSQQQLQSSIDPKINQLSESATQIAAEMKSFEFRKRMSMRSDSQLPVRPRRSTGQSTARLSDIESSSGSPLNHPKSFIGQFEAMKVKQAAIEKSLSEIHALLTSISRADILSDQSRPESPAGTTQSSPRLSESTSPRVFQRPRSTLHQLGSGGYRAGNLDSPRSAEIGKTMSKSSGAS